MQDFKAQPIISIFILFTRVSQNNLSLLIFLPACPWCFCLERDHILSWEEGCCWCWWEGGICQERCEHSGWVWSVGWEHSQDLMLGTFLITYEKGLYCRTCLQHLHNWQILGKAAWVPSLALPWTLCTFRSPSCNEQENLPNLLLQLQLFPFLQACCFVFSACRDRVNWGLPGNKMVSCCLRKAGNLQFPACN